MTVTCFTRAEIAPFRRELLRGRLSARVGIQSPIAA